MQNILINIGCNYQHINEHRQENISCNKQRVLLKIYNSILLKLIYLTHSFHDILSEFITISCENRTERDAKKIC